LIETCRDGEMGFWSAASMSKTKAASECSTELRANAAAEKLKEARRVAVSPGRHTPG